MKKILFYTSVFIFIAFINAKEINNFRLIEENEDNYIINFSMDEFNVESVGDYKKIITNSLSNTEAIGMPKLPLFTSLIEIEEGIEYIIDYDIKESEKIENIKIQPNQNMVNGKERTEIIDINQDYYNSDIIYPSSKIYFSDPMVMRDINISILSFIPFEYNPETEELEIFTSVEIRLLKNFSSKKIEQLERKKSKVFEKIYQNHVLNYNSSNRDEDYQDPSILYICGGSSESSSYFQNLIEWRNEIIKSK